MVRAAVLNAVGQPLEVRDDIEVEPPRAHEVKVRVVASGVCHSDLSMQDGTVLIATPAVLGHEGAGVVEEVGEGVEGVAPGDHVVISWVPQCGACFFCQRGQPYLCDVADRALISAGLPDGSSRLSAGGRQLRQMTGAGTFSEVTVVADCAVVKVPTDIDLRVAALLGCGVLTGIGAVTNTAHVQSGDTVAVVGCGGVGLNVVQGARLAGASRIIAVDRVRSKLELAEELGATDLVDATAGNPVSRVRSLTGERGVDVAFEVIGLQETIDQTVHMTRRGGQAVLVGLPRFDTQLVLPAFLGVVWQHKTIRGCWYGASDVRRDIPRLLELYRNGQLELSRLISRQIALDDVEGAFAALRTGEVARSVIVY